MTNALIGYENRLDEHTVTASSDPAATPKENAYDWALFDYWQPAAATSHYLDVDAGVAVTADYFAFYSSDLYTEAGAAVQLYGGSSSPATTLLGTINPTTRGPKFLQFTSASHRYWRLQFSTTGSFAPRVQLAAFGDRLELERGVQPGFGPPALASRYKQANSISDGGIFLGRSNRIQSVRFTIDLTVLSASWIRSNWPTLLAHIEQYPFFLLPEPDAYTDEAVIAWSREARIAAPAYQNQSYMDHRLSLEAFV